MDTNNELISIIIPIYNVEKYLEKCLDSVINQTYSNIEILLIDDGSNDKSVHICNQYEKKDRRIRVFHKTNEGVSSARNIGIKNAKGEYFIFIDSDDYLEKNMIESLYINLIKNDADISICDYYISYEDGNVEERNKERKDLVLDQKEFYRCILETNYFGGYLYNKLIRRRLIYDEEKVKLLDENIHICEDLVYVCEIAKNLKKAYYTMTPYYYYVQRKESALKLIYSEKQLSNFKAYKEIIEIYNEISMPINKSFEIKYLSFLSEALFLTKYLRIKDSNFIRELLEEKEKYYKICKNFDNIKFTSRIKRAIKYHFPYFTGYANLLKRRIKGEI